MSPKTTLVPQEALDIYSNLTNANVNELSSPELISSPCEPNGTDDRTTSNESTEPNAGVDVASMEPICWKDPQTNKEEPSNNDGIGDGCVDSKEGLSASDAFSLDERWAIL